MEKAFEELTIVELKSLGFDLINNLQQIQHNIQLIQNRIIELQNLEEQLSQEKLK